MSPDPPDYPYYQQASTESTARLPDGRVLTASTIWMQRSKGIYWESDWDTKSTFYYLDGEPITEEQVRALDV